MKKFQTGMSSLTLLLVLMAGAFVLLAAFKIGPLYIDNYFVRSSVNALQDEDVSKMSDHQIRTTLDRYFIINGVRDLSSRDVKIDRDSARTLVMMDYEKRIDFFANLDVVVSFENHFDTSDYQ
ncbi:MAG: DUF4845 domain-containing protein [Porticoccaceae bacterium]|nr:DUF4845 domain-containing protein [Porticoccaceae bacterium]